MAVHVEFGDPSGAVFDVAGASGKEFDGGGKIGERRKERSGLVGNGVTKEKEKKEYYGEW